MTENRLEYIRRWAGVKNADEIAAHLGISRETAYTIARRHGLSLAVPVLAQLDKSRYNVRPQDRARFASAINRIIRHHRLPSQNAAIERAVIFAGQLLEAYDA